MFNNEQTYDEWEADCLNKAKEILTMDKEKENNRSKKIETTANWYAPQKLDTFGGAYFYGKERAKI